jgi:hypothetical protein
MHQKFIVLLVFTIFSTKSLAEPVVMNCFLDDGRDIGELTIDIDKEFMKWNRGTYYRIMYINDTYITGFTTSNYIGSVGGEIWVVNRITGGFQRGYVGIYNSETRDKQNKPPTLQSGSAEGVCLKRQL